MSTKKFLAIASVFYPVGVTKDQKESLAIILNMRITATQMIAHYSVNFNLFHKSFALFVF